MEIHVEPAGPEQREVVGRLLELNAYEFSGIDGRPIGDDARYGYVHLEAYWRDADRYPYLIRAGGELAGLALIRSPDGEMTIAEFLVLPKFRRRAVGTRAARALFARHPGSWKITQVPGNRAVSAFWRHAIPHPFEERELPDGTLIQTFATE